MEMKNKKGQSIYGFIVAFFLLCLMFLFIVGMFDLSKVEIYEPISEILKNETLKFQNESSAFYQAMLQNDENLNNTDLPFNLLFLFISFMAFGLSMFGAIFGYKTDIFSWLGKTTAGIIALVYFAATFLIQIVLWFIEQLINPIFGDVILLYVPSFQYLIDYPFLIIIVWVCLGIVLNQIFGKEEVVRR